MPVLTSPITDAEFDELAQIYGESLVWHSGDEPPPWERLTPDQRLSSEQAVRYQYSDDDHASQRRLFDAIVAALRRARSGR